MFNTKEVEKIEVVLGVDVSDLTRRALLELVKRYKAYIDRNGSEAAPNLNDFLYMNPDLINKIRPDKDDVIQTVCEMIDYVDDILDRHNIVIPDDFRDDGSEHQSSIYGETYYDIEDFFINQVCDLIDEDEDEIFDYDEDEC